MIHKLSVAGLALLIAGAVPAFAATKASPEQSVVLKKKKMQAELSAKPRKQPGPRSVCGSFLQCLFSPDRKVKVVRTSVASASASSVDDTETGEDIAWKDANKYAIGSIVVKTPERRLYYILGNGEARVYKVGVGREGFQWGGTSKVVAKAEWPTWRPPQTMIDREAAKGHYLPDVMEGGPDNPLGARAMYIGGTMYRIHGTNNAASIGGAVSSGCIRMMNADVIELYERVKVGAKVYVIQ
ncbi:L,D-transpeptidase [Aestuariivirga sp.]|uniref:L,D-transpeptidase n=1 Tax=Aestuariivirga sp. TaxID=2650926 RepID=UPI0039E4A655